MLKQYFLPLSPRFFVISVIICSITVVLALFTSFDHTRPHHIRLQMQSSVPTSIDLYYDLGHGFSEQNRQGADIDRAGEWINVDFTVPAWERLYRLRFDTAGSEAIVKLGRFEILYNGKLPFRINLGTGQPNQQIQSSYDNDGQLVLRTVADSKDPFIIFDNIGAASGTSRAARLQHTAVWLFATLLLLLLIRAGYRYFFLGR